MPEQEGKTKGLGLMTPIPKTINLGRSWFLGIAINQYDHWPQLNNAVKDVEDFANLLLNGYDIEAECCTIIKEDQATEDNIHKELKRLRDQVEPTDKVLIYYSGHGHLENGKRGYWVPQDAGKDSTHDFVGNSTILEYLEDINSLHTLLISDACFSGSLLMSGATKSEDHALEELEQKPSRWALCSGRHNEEVHDGPPGENSPFAKALIAILSENTEDLLNIGALVDQVIHLTRTRYKQLPLGSPVMVEGHKWGEYIFKRLLDEDTFWEKTIAKGTLRDLSNYMLKFPKGKFLDKATRMVESIEEQDAWLKASKKHEPRSYRSFLTKFPRGYFMQPANLLLQHTIDRPVESVAPPPKSILEEFMDKPARSVEGKSSKGIPEKSIDLFEEEEQAILEELPMTAPVEVEITSGVNPPPSPAVIEPSYVMPGYGELDFCVIIDAGHGGLDDSGKYVTAPRKMFQHEKGDFHAGSQFFEGVWNRRMAAAIEERLESKGIHTICLHQDVEDTSLTMRTQMANKYHSNYGQTILLSIHSNSSPVPGKRGFEIYTAGSPQGNQLGSYLLKAVREKLAGKIPIADKDGAVIKAAKFYMLTSTKMPALLVEHLYFSNYEDAKLLMQEEIVEGFAEAYLAAILAYKREVVKK
ncbi:MAG: hypothetical protein Sapg2KO_01290 [Saprospiraceae bacterium]